MRSLAWSAVRNLVIGGVVILALAPLVPICSFIYFMSPSGHPLDED